MNQDGISAVRGGLGVQGMPALLMNARDSRRGSEQEEFAGVLARAREGEGTAEERARKAAEQLVSTALVQPIFKRLRESNGAAPPFGPNKVERTFGPMMDAGLAQRMVSSQRWGLVDELARRMLARVQPGSPAVRAEAA